MGRRAPALLVVGATAAAMLLFRQGGDEHAARDVPDVPIAFLPAAPAPAFSIPTPGPLHEPRATARWAPVLDPTPVRRSPSSSSTISADLDAVTPEGTANLVLVHGKHVADGRLWIQVEIPGLPGHTRGWVSRNSLGSYHAVRTKLVVDLRKLSATLLRDGESLVSFPIGVGADSSPTPQGDFYVRNRLTRFASRFYGPLAFGTSARSPSVTDWPDGGFVGIHGTDRPDLLPGRISHGCIRLRNVDIERLGRLMPVGTPISIR